MGSTTAGSAKATWRELSVTASNPSSACSARDFSQSIPMDRKLNVAISATHGNEISEWQRKALPPPHPPHTWISQKTTCPEHRVPKSSQALQPPSQYVSHYLQDVLSWTHKNGTTIVYILSYCKEELTSSPGHRRQDDQGPSHNFPEDLHMLIHMDIHKRNT